MSVSACALSFSPIVYRSVFWYFPVSVWRSLYHSYSAWTSVNSSPVLPVSQRSNCVGGGVRCHTIFDPVTDEENLFRAWERFRRGKLMKRTVAQFAMHAEDHLFALHAELRSGTYVHGPYEQFIVHDPKRRWINKASVRDRIVHQAIVQVIEPAFERTFIFDSYSSRVGKGTHACRARMAKFLRQASLNNRRNAWVLQCDIRRFFESIRHDVLLALVAERIQDPQLLELLDIVVRSFSSAVGSGRGLPLGNLTSQLFGNVYLNGLDHLVKDRLQMRWYVRFCDDFAIIHRDRAVLEDVLPRIRTFLADDRSLELHPRKVTIRKYSYGIDSVGQVFRPQVRTLRRATIRRAFRIIRLRTEAYHAGRLSDPQYRSTLQSLFGLCVHGSNDGVRQRMREMVWRMLRAWN